MNPLFRVLALVIAWLLWVMPFLTRARRRRPAARIDPRARWGIALTAAAFTLVLAHTPREWSSPVSALRLSLGAVFAAPSIALAWAAVRNLGKQWRIDAGLNADHELVTNGAYRIVRHPIYLSMFGMLLTITALAGILPRWPIALVLFAIGTEIRIRVEDKLLRERFGERFILWQHSVSAWIPFVR